MKKFCFSLQYLLDAHGAKEQAAESALQLAIAHLNETDRTLKMMAAKRQQQIHVLESMSGLIRRSDYSIYVCSIECMHQEIKALEQIRSTRAAQVEACRVTLRNEMTARRILENLCKRERSEWAENLQRDEQKQMDELAVVRWSRQESEK